MTAMENLKKDIYLSEESTIYPNPAIKEVNLLVGGQASNLKSQFSVLKVI